MSVILNIFRLTGDMMHLGSIILLLLKIIKTKSISGLSLYSQCLYLAVYVSRYLDLFHLSNPVTGAIDFLHLYNFSLKCLFLASQAYIIYVMLVTFHATYDKTFDTLKPYLLVAPCAVLAVFLVDYRFAETVYKFIREYFWTFSILLESVAILPQLFLLQKKGEAETITSHYLFCLGGYRAFYVLNWIYRWSMGSPPEAVVVLPGILQTALYSDFFWVYYVKVWKGRKFSLPV